MVGFGTGVISYDDSENRDVDPQWGVHSLCDDGSSNQSFTVDPLSYWCEKVVVCNILSILRMREGACKRSIGTNRR